MKPHVLLLLSLLAAGLGAFIWFVDRDLPSSEERAELSKKVFGGVEEEQVQAMVLDWDDHEVRLERQPAAKAPVASSPAETSDEGESEVAAAPAGAEIEAEPEWRITAPADLANARADRTIVDRLITAVLGLEKTRTVDGAQPEELGLDKPRAKVTLVTGGEGGKTRERVLVIGAEVPASASTLVRVDDRTDAYVVDGVFFSQVTRDAGDWRDRRLFTADRAAIERVTLRRGADSTAGAGGEPVVLARHGEELRLESPIVDRADRDKVDRLLGDLTSLSAQRFVDHPARPLADLGLDPAGDVVEVKVSGGGEPFRLELGAPAGDGSEGTEEAAGPASAPAAGARYGRAGGQLFVVDTQLGEAVERPVSEWQAPALGALSLYQIDKATIERGGKRVTLARDGTEWKRGDEKISYTPVSELLYAFSGARADRFLRRS